MNERTEAAILAAAQSIELLAIDVRGTTAAGTLGEHLRNTLRAIYGAAHAVEKLADNLRGDSYSSSHNTGDQLRAAIKRVGVKS